MKLRSKTLAIIGLTLVALIAVLYGISRVIVQGGFGKVQTDLMEGFSRIEVSNTRQNVQRVTDALAARIENLSVKAADWAMWDDTYKFIIDKNQAYVESNLTEDGMAALKINLIFMAGISGKEVFSMGYDLENESSTALPASLRQYLAPGSFLYKHENEESAISGILMLPEGPLMIVSRPIVKSDGSGPIHGSFLFGRFLDQSEFSDLASLTHLTINPFQIQQRKLPRDVSRLRKALISSDTILIQPLSEKLIAGYTAIRDVEGKPILLLRVDVPRDIHIQGVSTSRGIRNRGEVILLSLVISILASGLVLGCVILFVLEFSVLSRVTKLSAKAVHIGSSGDFSARVEAQGKDEITALASSINKMLEALHTTHLAMEARNAEMKLLMNTVPAGLVSLNEESQINPEYSTQAEAILGTKDLRNRSYIEILGLAPDSDGAKKLMEFLDFFRQELLPEKDLAALNPFIEYQFRSGSELKWLQLRYYLIRRGEGKPNHILVVIEDITKAKELAEQVKRSQGENVQLKAIAENPDLFREFLVETNQILTKVTEQALRLTPEEKSRPVVHEIFRGVHTIKGVAGSFGLTIISEIAGKLEDSLSPLREKGDVTPEAVNLTKTSLQELSKAFEAVVANSKQILGEELGKEAGILLRIPLEELKRHAVEIQNLQIEDEIKTKVAGRIKEEILRRLRELQAVPARKGLARSVKIVPGLIDRIGKKAKFQFDGQDTLIHCEVASELNTPLIHMLRNAFDHGIETEEERNSSSKPAEGRVSLTIQASNEFVTLTLSDDGKGLDPERLRSASVSKGILTPEEAKKLTSQQCLELIYRPGFSTAENVSDVSGRGVGMDAVLETVKKLKGEVKVFSEVGKGTQFTIKVPTHSA